MLKGGDRRSIGRADHAAGMVRGNRRLFPQLVSLFWSEDAVVRMRAVDAAEKVTREHPEWLAPYRKQLLGLLAGTERQELRWHLAVMVPRLNLSQKERQAASAALYRYLEDRSSIVKAFALEGLADLAKTDTSIRIRVIETLQKATRSGTPAMRARGRKLLGRLAAS